MLNVLDEKWKDHLYDLDQLRNAIHYRSWGQKDPLIEYKQEAYTMFVDLMNDVHNTFASDSSSVQLVFEAPPQPEAPPRSVAPPQPMGPTKRYNAFGIVEDIPAEAPGRDGNGTESAVDIGPAETPAPKPVAARKDPLIVGAGRTRSPSRGGTPANTDWSTVGRNDPCPCGSGKKFKKCHGAHI